jgi:signal transduction histidine kinase
MRWPPGIRARLTLVAVALSAVTMAIAAFLLVSTLERSLVSSSDELSRSRTRDVARSAEAGLLPKALTDVGDDGVAQVVADDGTVVAASPNVMAAAAPLTSFRPSAGPPVMLTLRGAPDDDEREDYRVWALRGTGISVYVGSSLESVHEVSLRLTERILVGLPALVAVLGVGTWLLVGRALRPVEEIRAEVADISHQRLNRRVPVPGSDDEVSRLAQTMNAMLARLEDASTRQREFVANAAHELRTPIAELRAELDVALAHPHLTNWSSTATDLLRDAERMDRLVHALLFLAREDAAVSQPLRPIDLDDVVLDEVARIRTTCPVPIDTSAVSAAPVVGNRDDLGRLVRNLLDNAVTHARARIEVSSTILDGHVEIVVADDGPGVPDEDLPHVFERFYRADPARTPPREGFGLGLAIARAVAEAHGGDIGVSEGAPGARFVVRLPLA